ncbi:MAG TPA: hypothetical protein VH575_06860 [Gemmataceae bacterium]
MRTTFLYLAVLYLVPHVDAAPAPAEGRAAKEKLEALKKRLPDLLSDWQKSEKDDWLPNQWTCKAELRLLRRVGPDRAKAVILFAPFDEKGASVRNHDLLLTIFLSYQDGCWTIERSEVAGRLTGKAERPTFAFLMLAFDEAAEK